MGGREVEVTSIEGGRACSWTAGGGRPHVKPELRIPPVGRDDKSFLGFLCCPPFCFLLVIARCFAEDAGENLIDIL